MELLLGQVLHYIQLRTMEGMIMVIATTMANNGIRFGDIQSMFPSSRYRAVSELYKSSRSVLWIKEARLEMGKE